MIELLAVLSDIYCPRRPSTLTAESRSITNAACPAVSSGSYLTMLSSENEEEGSLKSSRSGELLEESLVICADDFSIERLASLPSSVEPSLHVS